MIQIKVPATSANCCVGFDCLGIALNLYNEFSFEITDEPMDSNNMAIHAYEFATKKFNKEPITVKVDIKANVPIARGLGSSSTCILAGILAADYYHKLNLTKEQIMLIASELEGHPDNVIPATIGSMALSCYKDGKLTVNPIEINDYYFLAVIPNKRIRTKEARGVLPKEVDHAKAAEQIYHAIAFIQAIQNGDEGQLYLNCIDYLHEPFRKQLISEYDELKK